MDESRKKNKLAITLTEPVVFLRPRTVRGEAVNEADPGPSSMLRGLLSLTVHKPTRISSISVELTCTTRTKFPESVGSRAAHVPPEQHTVYRAVATFFDASCCSGSLRRTKSAGSTLCDLEDDEAPLPPLASPREFNNARRRFSTDRTIHQRDPIVLQSECYTSPPPEVPADSPLSENPSGPSTPNRREPPMLRAVTFASVDSDDCPRKSAFTLSGMFGAASARLSALSPRGGTNDEEPAKEFKPGNYTYPIAFTIPANAPPTLHCDFGTVNWQIKASARRPGILAPRLRADRDVTVIAAPREEDIEDFEPILMEREVDRRLHCYVAISGRAFVEGLTIPLSIKLIPIEKVVVRRIAIYLEEKTFYLTEMRYSRSEVSKRHTLLDLQNPRNAALLPLDSASPNPLESSPLADVFVPSNADDELRASLISSFMGPGPWTLDARIQLPGRGSTLVESNKNKRSNMLVDHTLRIVFRVAQAGAAANDFQTLTLETPVYIFPWVCAPAVVTLPQYRESLCTSEPGVSLAAWPFEQHRLASAQWGRAHHSQLLLPAHTRSEDSTMYERLMAGQEGEMGDSPPAYDSAKVMRV